MTRLRAIGKDFAFLEWLRKNEMLDSTRERLSVTDLDIIVHQYPSRESRNPKERRDNMIVLETKSHATGPVDAPFAQVDTLRVFHLLLESKRQSPVRPVRIKVPAPGGGKETRSVVFWGVHILAMSGDRPDNSGPMWWDKKPEPIDQETLQAILRFEVDPFTLGPIDYRDHHRGESARWPLFRAADWF